MSPRKNKVERERELAAHFEAHKEDAEEWEEKPVRVLKPSKVGAVYSIRLTAEEVEGLRAIADLERLRISDLIHEAIRKYLATGRTADHCLVTDFARQRTFYYSPGSEIPTRAVRSAKVTYSPKQPGPTETQA
ncbi:MAG: hypothetical protein HYX92_17165 [Chloroflexi bacterium]|nr:hypothetical protein [Chloroflexota bacterium]